MSTRDGLVIEYREIEAQMRGISPKLELHQRLANRLVEIRDQMGGMSAPPDNKPGVKTLTSSNGTRIQVYEGKRPQPELASLKCTHLRPTACKVPGCVRKTKPKGKCGNCGKSRYSNYCKKHGADDLIGV